ERRAILAARGEEPAPEHQEARRVVGAVLDLRDQDLQAIDLGRGLACDRGAPLLVAGAPRPLGVAGYRHLLDARQVLVQPLPALAETGGASRRARCARSRSWRP